MSIRTERVATIVRETVAEALALGEVKDPRVRGAGLVTVTHVRVSADLSVAWVQVSAWGGGGVDQAVEGLRAAAGFLRSEVGRRLEGKKVPELRFEADREAEREARVEAAFREIEAERRRAEGASDDVPGTVADGKEGSVNGATGGDSGHGKSDGVPEAVPEQDGVPDALAFEDTQRVDVPYPAHIDIPPLRRKK